MTDDSAKTDFPPAEPPFQRPMRVATLTRDAETKFRVTAEPGELTDLAPYLGVSRVERLSFAGFISPDGEDGWRIRGNLVARVEQACVVTLAPLSFRHEIEVERRYLPAGQLIEGPEIRVLHDEADMPDPFTDSLDPAQLAVESLALAIDPYPRAEGAKLPEAATSGAQDPKADRPFSALAALKLSRDDESA